MSPDNTEAVIEALYAYGEAARWDYHALDGAAIREDMWVLADVLDSPEAYTAEEIITDLGIIKTDLGYEWA